MNQDRLAAVAQRMVARGKGLLAADESTGTIKRRFDHIGVESTPDSRRDYRELMFRTEKAMQNYISGVILYDETIRQQASDGTPLVELIERFGAIAGIKVDLGARPMPLHPGETVTEGLDGLAERLSEYHRLGARFAKWRAVIDIGEGVPSWACIKANAHALASYAALCQEAEIVPIVEPEVLMDGGHTIERCYEVSEKVLRALYDELYEARVFLEGTILKPNMVIPGKKCPKQASPDEVAEWTVKLFKREVPVAVPGITFLSGGQSDVDATANLNAINRLRPLPWAITFSYGRALQAAPQEAWSGKAENVDDAQKAFEHRARMNGLAAMGEWSRQFEAS